MREGGDPVDLEVTPLVVAPAGHRPDIRILGAILDVNSDAAIHHSAQVVARRRGARRLGGKQHARTLLGIREMIIGAADKQFVIRGRPEIQRKIRPPADTPDMIFPDVDIAVGDIKTVLDAPSSSLLVVEGCQIADLVAEREQGTPPVARKFVAHGETGLVTPLIGIVIELAFARKVEDPTGGTKGGLGLQIDAATDGIAVHVGRKRLGEFDAVELLDGDGIEVHFAGISLG